QQIWRILEPESKVVGAYRAERRQACRQTAQIERSPEFMNLHGIPSAQADRRMSKVVQVGKLTHRTGHAVLVSHRLIDLPDLARPYIRGCNLPRGGLAAENPHRFRHLPTGDESGDRA